jgi:hypothetical protein
MGNNSCGRFPARDGLETGRIRAAVFLPLTSNKYIEPVVVRVAPKKWIRMVQPYCDLPVALEIAMLKKGTDTINT